MRVVSLHIQVPVIFEERKNFLKHIHPSYDWYKALVNIFVNGRKCAIKKSCKNLQIRNCKNKHQNVEWDISNVMPKPPY